MKQFGPKLSTTFVDIWSKNSVTKNDYIYCMKELYAKYEAITARYSLFFYFSLVFFVISSFSEYSALTIFLGITTILFFLKSMEANILLELNTLFQFRVKVDQSTTVGNKSEVDS